MQQHQGDWEQRIAGSLRKGEERAFDQLFREFFAPLTYFAHKLIDHKADAEDLVQECFVSLWHRRKSLAHIQSVKSYLFTAVRFQCIKYLQKKKKEVYKEIEKADDRTIDKLIIAAEMARELYKALAQLSPALQEVLRLSYLEGKTNQEIARLMNIDTRSVIKYKFRALLALRKQKISLS